MANSEEVDCVDLAVRALYRNKYSRMAAWTDDFSEFKSYSEVKNGKSVFFRIHETPTEYRYSEDSHQRVSVILSGLLVGLEVERFEQSFDRTAYLLRSDCNYVALSEFIKIKRGNIEEADPKFIVHILNFLKRVIPVLVSEQIESELSLNTVCFYEDKIKLCDYNLFFYPCNKRSDKLGLQQIYLKRSAAIVYSLLTYRNPQKLTEVERSEATELLLNISERESFKSNDLFREIIRTLLLENVLLEGRLQLLTQKVIYDFGSSLTDSNITLRDEANDSYDCRLSKKNTMTTVADLEPYPPKKNRKTLKIVFSLICILFLFLVIGSCIYFFVFMPHVCRSDQISDGQNCLTCVDGCKKCIGQKNNECTACWAELWLVKENIDDIAGMCAVECFGEKYEGRMCISRNHTWAANKSSHQ